MTTSHQQLTSALSSDVIPIYWRSYFREYARGLVHNQLLGLFQTWKEQRDGNRAELARKVDRSPSQITRWLAAPSNLEIDTISDMALAMGCVPKITFETVSALVESQSTASSESPIKLEMLGSNIMFTRTETRSAESTKILISQ